MWCYMQCNYIMWKWVCYENMHKSNKVYDQRRLSSVLLLTEYRTCHSMSLWKRCRLCCSSWNCLHLKTSFLFVTLTETVLFLYHFTSIYERSKIKGHQNVIKWAKCSCELSPSAEQCCNCRHTHVATRWCLACSLLKRTCI